MKKQSPRSKATLKVALNAAVVAIAVGTTILSSCKKEGVAENEQLTIAKNSSKGSAEVQSYQSGTNNGYFWSLWKDDQSGYVTYTNGSGGNYSVSWNYTGNFTCGKGWSNGSPTRKIGYNCGAYTCNGGGVLAYYGWTRSPLIEYYVNEKWGSSRPTGEKKGSFWSDGAQYDIYTAMRYNAPSIDGTQTFRQIFSTRTSQAPTGQNKVITFGNHAYAWQQAGLSLGSDFSPAAILLTEAYGGSNGYVNASVWQQ